MELCTPLLQPQPTFCAPRQNAHKNRAYSIKAKTHQNTANLRGSTASFAPPLQARKQPYSPARDRLRPIPNNVDPFHRAKATGQSEYQFRARMDEQPQTHNVNVPTRVQCIHSHPHFGARDRRTAHADPHQSPLSCPLPLELPTTRMLRFIAHHSSCAQFMNLCWLLLGETLTQLRGLDGCSCDGCMVQSCSGIGVPVFLRVLEEKRGVPASVHGTGK